MTDADEPRDGAHVLVAADGTWLRRAPAAACSLARRRVLVRLLGALARRRTESPGLALAHAELAAAAWPGTRAQAASLQNRLRVAMCTLRALGLGTALRTGARGYWLDPLATAVVHGPEQG